QELHPPAAPGRLPVRRHSGARRGGEARPGDRSHGGEHVTGSRRALPRVLLLGLSLLAPAAQAADSVRAAILGSWQGTSTCVRPAAGPACKDEVVLYKFRPVPARTDRVTLDAFKRVGRKWSLMGTMDFTFDSRQGRWT